MVLGRNKNFQFILTVISLVSVNHCAPSTSSIEPPPIVKTKNGELIGKIATTLLDQRKFFSFRGIPYAKPPVGSLRFRVSIYNLLSVVFVVLIGA